MKILEKDILMAIEITKYPNTYNAYDEMGEYSRIYQNTTENIKLYMPFLSGYYKKALLPTSSGDHQLEAILSGITEITCYDLNRLARYFTELKFGAIESLTREEFIYFMYEDMLNKDIFDFFKDSLNEDISVFWEELYKKCNIEDIRNSLFRYLGCIDGNFSITGIDFSKYCVDNFTSYLEKSNYKLVQDRLEKANIQYIESNLLDLPKILEEKYDLINLTNIYEFVNNGIFGNGVLDFTDSVKRLDSYLNDDGKILVTYLYKCYLKDIKKYSNKTILYAKFLWMIEKMNLGTIHDMYADRKNKRTIMDKLYAFRNVQLIRYMKDLDIDVHEISRTGLGCGMGEQDMILVYKKNVDNWNYKNFIIYK